MIKQLSVNESDNTHQEVCKYIVSIFSTMKCQEEGYQLKYKIKKIERKLKTPCIIIIFTFFPFFFNSRNTLCVVTTLCSEKYKRNCVVKNVELPAFFRSLLFLLLEPWMISL